MCSSGRSRSRMESPKSEFDAELLNERVDGII